eukprot:4849758-Alexandrium_andersonii.AAC.1
MALDAIRKGYLVVGGWALKARPQVPKYLRGAQQLLRCLMAVYSDMYGLRDSPMVPVWDVQA